MHIVYTVSNGLCADSLLPPRCVPDPQGGSATFLAKVSSPSLVIKATLGVAARAFQKRKRCMKHTNEIQVITSASVSLHLSQTPSRCRYSLAV